jgi:epoxyqueuosine reductase QueG
LAEICRTVVVSLSDQGVAAAWEAPTHDFDPVRLVSAWSHKSVAALAGIGAFGHHHMLITAAGCAGRLGSIVLGTEIEPTPAMAEPVCAFDDGCRACVRRCPAGALTEQGLGRARCYAQCLANDARFAQWTADVCGKCATGPCALRPGGVGPRLTA